MPPQKQVQIEKFYCVVLLIVCDINVVSILSHHVPTPARAFNGMPISYAFFCEFALVR